MAGQATRLKGLPLSKELFPFGLSIDDISGTKRFNVISDVLINRMRKAGVQRFHLIIREGKWDIPSYFKDGEVQEVSLAYHITRENWGVPFSLDIAYPFIRDHNVMFGFPDIFVRPEHIFYDLAEHLRHNSHTDMVLGTFPVEDGSQWDVVRTNDQGKLLGIELKDPEIKGEAVAWVIAAWRPSFTNFLHTYVKGKKAYCSLNQEELYLGKVIHDFSNEGFRVDTVHFEHGECVDIGTPENLQRALKMSTGFNSEPK